MTHAAVRWSTRNGILMALGHSIAIIEGQTNQIVGYIISCHIDQHLVLSLTFSPFSNSRYNLLLSFPSYFLSQHLSRLIFITDVLRHICYAGL